MNHFHYRRHLANITESGQSAVLFMLSLIGLMAFVGLAVDGGSVLNERRIVQNASDASALRGVHYIVSSDSPDETGLCATVNRIVEGNGVADTDGIAGNAINDHVQIIYTDDSGERASITGGPEVDCDNPRDSIPPPAQGVEVLIDTQTDTYFLGVIGLDTLDVGSRAVAVTRGAGGPASQLKDNAMVAFGNCDKDDRPLDLSGHFMDVIGGLHSDTWFENRGEENHYHGQVTYGEGYGWIDTPEYSLYEPEEPQPSEALGDPFAGLFTVDDFNCTDGSIGSTYGDECYDLTDLAPGYGGEVNTRLLVQNSPDGGEPYLSEETGKLRDGIYYAGDYPFFFGLEPSEIEDPPEDHPPGMHGEVTLVTSNYIKITENDVQLTGYLDTGSVLPGLLMYSGLDMTGEGKACTNHEELADDERPINTTGNEGTVAPQVWHDDGCVNLDNPAECYTLGSLQYNGILYAPGGRVATSGHGASYVGAIVAYSIRVNGYIDYCEWYSPAPCRPEENDAGYEVGVLFVFDSNLFPTSDARIYLDE
jgi:hypothetical protein